MTANITEHEVMRVRHHHGFSHGLAPGTDRDINCTQCMREDAAELADSEARFGLCTRDPAHGPAEVPWSGERLCWGCADADLDRLAVQLQNEPVQVGGFGLGNIPHLEPRTPTQDELAAALAEDLLALCDGNLDRINAVLAKLGTEEVWDGQCGLEGCTA